ncbi:hypothetical protein ABB37_06635 [Leptomonas pyrrhocoris]|uniref:Uncharacterized protein n=1 Tax=Leptomonas pyrrhocoris TaxID=157538 RepID=A0A0N0DTQ1_LEPPY|nr:hypothetical protein ABB37_06635 [Leptomonas pyrrhocoris]KPA77818.1 hypothetical protein ABB37_06635 [Leptomonas pyrrhocoris]|eukprot:XP_015656257.1 hypothetical protein ABB37_06635 [Leptomonas pyrrhocoris]
MLYAMAPPSFTRFMLRRVLCTTLFFITLLVVVSTATSVYYVVRINTTEKHQRARALKSAQAGKANAEDDGALTHLYEASERAHAAAATAAESPHQPAERATRAVHGELAGRLRSPSTPRYEEPYKVLAVNAPLSRQAVRNPTFSATIPLWENVETTGEETQGMDEHAVSRVRVPARQRYVLAGLEAGKHYMLRLSFLGSPSVTFEMLLYQVPRSQLDTARHKAEATAVEEAKEGEDSRHRPRVPNWSTVPQDTELRVFAMSATSAQEFDEEEEDIWLEEAAEEDDVGDVAGAGVTRVPLHTSKASTGRYVPVVEVRPRALSIPIDAARLPVVRFNIAVEPLSSSFLPQVAVPLIAYGAWVTVFIGYLCIYTFVSSGVAGGRPHDE